MYTPDSEIIPVIMEALARGQRVRMTVNGHSMTPFINNGDIVEVSPIPLNPVAGSVVLAQLPNERYPLHRLVKQYDQAWLLRGDNCRAPDGKVVKENLVGIVTRVERKGRIIHFSIGSNSGRYIAWLSNRSYLLPLTRFWKVFYGKKRNRNCDAKLEPVKVNSGETAEMCKPGYKIDKLENSTVNQDATSLLLTCLGYGDKKEKAERLAAVTHNDWEGVIKLARRHIVAPFLYDRLVQLNLILPDPILKELKEEYLKQSFRNIYLYEELAKLLELLNSKNIEVIVLKGAYLAGNIYDNIGLRGMSDIDLLVKEKDLFNVDQELLALGIHPEDDNREVIRYSHHFDYLMPEQGIRLEVHWNIIKPIMPCRIDTEGLWNRASMVELRQKPTLALCPEDLLLHLCLHTANHVHSMEFRMLCDIGETLKHFNNSLNWSVLSERARQWGITRAVYVVLSLASELLEIEVPHEWLESVKPEQFDESYLKLTRSQFLGNSIDTSVIAVTKLWKAKGINNKRVLIFERILPSDEMTGSMSAFSFSYWRIFLRYVIKRSRILWARHGKVLWQLSIGDAKTKTKVDKVDEVNSLRDWLLSG